MLEEVSVCWYRVSKCGYYRARHDAPEFYGLAPLMTDLALWSRGKQYAETASARLSPEQLDAGLLPVYLQKVVGGGDSWLFTLWNETPANDGMVMSLPAFEMVGGVRVHENEIRENSIPGFATYFYVIPSQGLIAGVRFGGNTYGHDNMRRYLGGIVASRSRHAVLEQGADPLDVRVLGYAVDPAVDEPQPLNPMFRSDVLRQAGQRELLMERAGDIRKVVRRSLLQAARAPDRALWQRMLDHVYTPDRGLHRLHDTRVHYEMSLACTREELAEMVRQWDADAALADPWEDMGFKLAGEMGKTYWVNHSTASTKVSLDVTRLNRELVDAQSALDELHRHRDVLLAVIRDDPEP